VESDQPETDWRSYDSVAEAYADVVTLRHAVMARDLVALVAPRFGGRVLDVGAGAGAAAQAAVGAVGGSGAVVALDPSVRLLRRVVPPQRIHTAAALAGALPVRADVFDAVVANLVLGHVPDFSAALSEMVRAARPGGRVGVTAVGVLGDAPPVRADDEATAATIWAELAHTRVDAAAIDAAAREVLPWEAWFSDPSRLRAALEEAGLVRVELTGRAYRSRTSHEEWLRSVNTAARARYLRATLSTPEWDEFGAAVLDRLHATVPEPFERVDQMLYAVGTVPPAR
jgi:ubiquinone/menaquinone biosynthesis C-methylase UbiE